jgi:DNA mismatch repair ATPase MutL
MSAFQSMKEDAIWSCLTIRDIGTSLSLMKKREAELLPWNRMTLLPRMTERREGIKQSMVAIDRSLLASSIFVGEFAKGFLIYSYRQSTSQVFYIVDQHAAHERCRLEWLAKENPGLGWSELQSIACKGNTPAHAIALGAIKLTSRTSGEFKANLIKTLSKCTHPFICAHGRPLLMGLVQIAPSDVLAR